MNRTLCFISMKKCKDCGEEKKLDLFHRKKMGKYGRGSICKSCLSVRIQASKILCLDCTKKITPSAKRCQSCKQRGARNSQWKGGLVGYRCLHRWVENNKPKSVSCEKCRKGGKKLEAANISQKYKRDIADYWWLCRSCHLKYDIKCGVR